MRTLDQIYWDSRCSDSCPCKSLEEALQAHPELSKDRDGEEEPAIGDEEDTLP